jgi:hypothetical protein
VIWRATADDLDRVVELGAAFHAYSPYRDIPFDPEGFRGSASRLIEAGAIFLSEDGMLGGLLVPLYFNPAVIMGAELFWWAGKTGRGLREAFEAWAKEAGAHGVQFSGLTDQRAETIHKVFARAGYQPAETAFFKRFEHGN